ncbi:MAG: hypothetical protein AAF404_23290, partial [Pseudomonadota bacterium]
LKIAAHQPMNSKTKTVVALGGNMIDGKLAVAGLAMFLVTGCSQFSDTKPVTTDAGETDAVAAVEDSLPATPMPVVEINATTNAAGVAEQRPIKLPLMQQQDATMPAMVNPVVTTETFEFGNDASLDESPVAQRSAIQVAPRIGTHNGQTRFAPTYPDRPVPERGMVKTDVLAAVGEPANRMTGNGSEVWDYGTYRVFFSADEVAFTSVW